MNVAAIHPSGNDRPAAAATPQAAAAQPDAAPPRPRPSVADLLDAVPVHNRAIRTEHRQGRFLVHVPIRKRWWNRPPLSWWLPYREHRTYELDRLGRGVFDACDGRRSVEAIVERFATERRVHFHEARGLVSDYLRTLVEKRLIVVILPNRGAKGGEATASTANHATGLDRGAGLDHATGQGGGR